jgi:hypothetical protein
VSGRQPTARHASTASSLSDLAFGEERAGQPDGDSHIDDRHHAEASSPDQDDRRERDGYRHILEEITTAPSEVLCPPAALYPRRAIDRPRRSLGERHRPLAMGVAR